MTARSALILVLALIVVFVDSGCRRRGQKSAPPAPDYDRALRPGELALVEVPPGELPEFRLVQTDREGLLAGIDASLKYLATPTAAKTYPRGGVSLEQVKAGLQRFRSLLAAGSSDAELNAAIRSDFKVMQSVGWDGRGSVLFTGYYTPIFDARLQPDATYRFPLYKRPADLVTNGLFDSQQKLPDGGSRPYPGRKELETSGVLKGLELAWFADEFDPYIIQVQGSAKLRLPGGRMLEVGNHGTTGHQYVPIGMKMIEDGAIAKDGLSLTAMRDWFRAHPDQVTHYAHQNPRMVFFTEAKGGPFGSIGVPVRQDVTIATDKAIFPPGALCFVSTRLGMTEYTGFRVDQDAGGAIQAPGRCDLYMGEGEHAEQRAGVQKQEGRLYYVLAR